MHATIYYTSIYMYSFADPVSSSEDSGTPAWAIASIVAVSVIILAFLIIIGVIIQIKVGFWCCHGHFAARQRVTRSQTHTSIASKAEFLKHQSSRDCLLKEPSHKPKITRSRLASNKFESSKRVSLLRGTHA